jgi:anhydro-N-acetylmuramic acid kinase
MSGTSLDGADGALVQWPSGNVLGFASVDFPAALRNELLALCQPGDNEIDRCGHAAIALAKVYAQVVDVLLAETEFRPQEVAAIGCHGQTIRHRPEAGFTLQLQSPAHLAEMTGIQVVADFRSRDMAAGGQGAPLAPAFHEAVFGQHGKDQAIVNIGGISNVSLLSDGKCIAGFDCGPGNVLLDHWAGQHLGKRFDMDGEWAASAVACSTLLESFLCEPFFQQTPPKSTGRELFNASWLEERLRQHQPLPAAQVQATLLELTAHGIRLALSPERPLNRVLICGGGALNKRLMQRLGDLFECPVLPTDAAGIPATQVEAIAFSWLAHCAIAGQRLHLEHITGSRHPVPLGAIYPA